MPLESWHIILQWTAAILVGVTFLVGLATVWVGVKVNKEQAERIANLDLKRAEAEERIEELRKAQIRAKVGRWAFVGPLGEFVKGKPKGSAEVIFTPEDDEAFRTAMAIEAELSASGGWRITNNARPYSSDDILPRFSQGNPFNEPLLSRVGGLNSGLTVIISPADFDDETAFIKEGTAAHALYFGLISCGFEPLPNFDGRLQAGAVRIVVGQK